MSYKPARCPDCGNNVQMCCCQAWAKNSQSEDTKLVDAIDRVRVGRKRLVVENTIMRSVLNEIADPYDCKWYKSSHDADDIVDVMIAMARMAIKKVDG